MIGIIGEVMVTHIRRTGLKPLIHLREVVCEVVLTRYPGVQASCLVMCTPIGRMVIAVMRKTVMPLDACDIFVSVTMDSKLECRRHGSVFLAVSTFGQLAVEQSRSGPDEHGSSPCHSHQL